MKTIMKMILYRIWQNKLYFLISLLIIPVVLFSAIFFAFPLPIKATVAVIGKENLDLGKEIRVVTIPKALAFSELVEGKYDAILTFEENGSYTIDTIKQDSFKEEIMEMVEGKRGTLETSKRGAVTNFIGFISLFVLLFNSMLFKFYYEERKGIEERVLSSSIRYSQYAFSHFLVIFLLIFLPTILLSLLANVFLFQSPVGMLPLSFTIFVLCFFATAFNFFIASYAKTEENGSLVASMIIMISTLLSGGLSEVNYNQITELLSLLFPQKYILDFINTVESGGIIHYGAMIIIGIVSVFLLQLGILFLKKRVTTRG